VEAKSAFKVVVVELLNSLKVPPIILAILAIEHKT